MTIRNRTTATTNKEQEQEKQKRSHEQPHNERSISSLILSNRKFSNNNNNNMKQRPRNATSSQPPPPPPGHPGNNPPTQQSTARVPPPSRRSSPSKWIHATIISKLSVFHAVTLTLLVIGISFQFLPLLQQRRSMGLNKIVLSNDNDHDEDPYRLILTNLGWNHPTPKVGLQFGRTLFSTELYHGILQQERYDPNHNGMAAWEFRSQAPHNNKWPWSWLYSLSSRRDYYSPSSSLSSTFTYVFVDVETCFEQIWPYYGGGLTANSDATGGRPRISSSGGIRRLVAEQACPYVQHILDHSPLFQRQNQHQETTMTTSNPSSPSSSSSTLRARLVIFDCGYYGPTPPCWSRTENPHYIDDRVSLVSLSANHRQHWSTHDIGLLPPAVTSSHLNDTQRLAIEQCTDDDQVVAAGTGTESPNKHPPLPPKNRPYLLTFVGNFRHPVRQALAPLHNNKTVIILPRFERGNNNEGGATVAVVGDNDETIQEKYKTILQQSQFAAVPRGDYLYTYRLLEVISAGAIPVILANDWVLPFHTSVVDWSEMAVLLPESKASQVLDYLSNLTSSERCRMRRVGYQYYQTYMATPKGMIRGIVESLEHLRRGKQQ